MNNSPRTRSTAKGHSCKTVLSDIEAVNLLPMEGSNFALELHSKAGKHGLSHDQIVWAHTLAMKIYNASARKLNPAKVVSQSDKDEMIIVGSHKIVGYLRSAKDSGIKRPKIRLLIHAQDKKVLTTVVLTLLEDDSVRITDHKHKAFNNKFGADMPIYYGKLTVEGEILGGKDLPGLFDALQMMANDPEGMVKAYGQETGSCCFCGRKLTDARSLAAFYGPVCAVRYSMPWGK